MVLTYSEFQRAENAIITTIQAADGPMLPILLIADLKQQGISEDLARAAMWYLIDRDRIELTQEWLLASSTIQPGQQGAGDIGTGAG